MTPTPVTTATGAAARPAAWWTPRWSNWRLALVVAAVVLPAAALTLPVNTAFWLSLAAAGLVAVTAVVDAWGRRRGPLLVAPALALLFVTNLFPLMWSLGLSFFHYRANRAAAPVFAGFARRSSRAPRCGTGSRRRRSSSS